jgi:hypothetical protein
VAEGERERERERERHAVASKENSDGGEKQELEKQPTQINGQK